MSDWHETQDQEYLDLISSRLESQPLDWVKQFIQIIRKEKTQSINDIGCNVGHFYKGLNDLGEIDLLKEYRGFDVSETYLEIARKRFPESKFENLDISKTLPRRCDVTVVSATLEHIPDHEASLNNLINSTSSLLIIRTFLGEKFLEDICKKEGAIKPYIIKQFSFNYFEKILEKEWNVNILTDSATKSVPKNVCPTSSIIRQQKVIVARKKWTV